ncbi:hypothetical protein [Trinickia sp.]|uniref:hypothetical protein n=1 Tax=Trinickia sp. TaxID=2571163 RepID=UPI003F8101A0
MRSRSALALIAAFGLVSALPVHAESNAPAVKPSSETAGPNQVVPPLPSLASLPASSAEQLEEAAPAGNARRPGKKTRHVAGRKAFVEPSIRVVVSDESQAYLTEVDRKLDDALRNTRDGRTGTDAVSLAWTR